MQPTETTTSTIATGGRRVVAAFLNLLTWPGFGHVFVGRRRAAAVWAGLQLASFIAVRFTVWAVIAILVVRLASLVEVAARRVPVRAVPHGGAAIGWVLGALASTVVMRFVIVNILVEGFTIPTVAMTPALHAGDYVYVDKFAYLARAPRRGEIAVMRNDDGPNTVKRIVALGGDTVEIRCGRLILNGEFVTGPTSGTIAVATDRGTSRPEPIAIEQLGDTRYPVVMPRVDDDGELDTTHDYPDVPYSLAELDDELPTGVVVTNREALLCQPAAHLVVAAGRVFTLGDYRTNSNDSRTLGTVGVFHLVGPVIGIWWAKDLGRLGDL